ncbi:MAG: transcription termination/antitermination protein NusG [Lachnospiraceae bacterium]|nr:transcription termination/antitermination protein NusG [Lachnospiraceae bacterium]
MAEANWYVVHTYSGYENKVKANIEKTIENRGLQDEILEVSVPLQNVVEIKNGVRKPVQKKLFPGYVLLKMVMNDDTWYVVRNTRGVTGFVGPGSKPVPLTEEEIKAMGVTGEEIVLDFEVGDTVTVMAGAWEGQQGIVKKINEDKQTVTIGIDVFGRETPVELGYTDVRSEL